MTRFWLIRHGEPSEEARNRCYGSLDVGLSDRGRAQMAQAAEYLKTEPIAAIYASPLSRALESARILATVASCEIKVASGLREIDFGGFEGLTYDEIASRFPDLYQRWMDAPTEVRFPNGENFSEMRARVLSAFAEIERKQEGQTIAIVSHGGVNRILIAWALQMPDNSVFRVAQDYAALSLLTLVDGLPTVHLLNYRPA